MLEKKLGQTSIAGDDEAPRWQWPAR
jgi:hypothetical protein